jgi:poly(A) polymerase
VEQVLGVLHQAGYGCLLQTYSALDRYYRVRNGHTCYILTAAPLAELAVLFDPIDYGAPGEQSAAIEAGGVRVYFQCVESLADLPRRAFTLQHFYYDAAAGRFIDAAGMYADLRARLLRPAAGPLPSESAPLLAAEAAILISRYRLDCPDDLFGTVPENALLGIRDQRWLLTALLDTDHPEKGFSLLQRTGFIRSHWPELESMITVPQTKDYHPEGNVLNHALGALAHRKHRPVVLSLAILLHDLGKTVAEATRENPFKDHADRGALLARNFLKRLDFPAGLIEDTLFLIRHHMMPEALPRMPLYRIEKLLAAPLFPLLLELFRADLLSTFRGPEKYYEACRIYRAYLKRTGNPYKTMRLDKPVS